MQRWRSINVFEKRKKIFRIDSRFGANRLFVCLVGRWARCHFPLFLFQRHHHHNATYFFFFFFIWIDGSNGGHSILWAVITFASVNMMCAWISFTFSVCTRVRAAFAMESSENVRNRSLVVFGRHSTMTLSKYIRPSNKVKATPFSPHVIFFLLFLSHFIVNLAKTEVDLCTLWALG